MVKADFDGVELFAHLQALHHSRDLNCSNVFVNGNVGQVIYFSNSVFLSVIFCLIDKLKIEMLF